MDKIVESPQEAAADIAEEDAPADLAGDESLLYMGGADDHATLPPVAQRR